MRTLVYVGFLVSVFLTGCGARIESVGAPAKFQGKAVKADGTPLPNVLVVLQPTENGFVTEIEADKDGKFSGEAIPGKYVYYFAPSKKGKVPFPKDIAPVYLEPKMEHLVSVNATAEVVCKVE